MTAPTAPLDAESWALAIDANPSLYDAHEVMLARAYLAQQKRIAELRDGLREALDEWSEQYPDWRQPNAIKRLRALLEGT